MRPLSLAQPCDASWQEMRRTPGGRHCAACDAQVWDLAALSERRLRVLLGLHGARGLCARQVIDPDGALVLAPEPRPASALRAAAWATAGAAMTLAQPAWADPSGAPPQEARPTAAEATASGDVPVELAQTAPAAIPEEDTPLLLGAVVSDSAIEIKGELTFAPGSTRIRRQSVGYLHELASALLDFPEIGRIAIIGHQNVDERAGSKGHALALARAERARAWLIDAGVDPARLVAMAHAADGHSDDDRVVFHVCEDDCRPPAGAVARP